jgi:hypothetical protein
VIARAHGSGEAARPCLSFFARRILSELMNFASASFGILARSNLGARQ